MSMYKFAQKQASWLAIRTRYDLCEIGFTTASALIGFVLIVGAFVADSPIFTRGTVFTYLARWFGGRALGQEGAEIVCGILMLIAGCSGLWGRKSGRWWIRTKAMCLIWMIWGVYCFSFLVTNPDNPSTYVYMTLTVLAALTWLLMLPVSKIERGA